MGEKPARRERGYDLRPLPGGFKSPRGCAIAVFAEALRRSFPFSLASVTPFP
jgi:hypothetical protein